MEHDYIAALDKYGSKRAAARALNIPESTLRFRLKKQESVKALNKLGLKIIDAEAAVMDGLSVSGTSRYYKLEDGGVWIKTKKEHEDVVKVLNAAVDAMCEDIPKAKPRKKPKGTEKDLLSCYIVTDYHMGMLAWDQEAGDNWDTDIAYDTLMRFFKYSIASTPNAKVGVLAQLGDFLHYDSLDAVTPSSGHVLDADTRLPKLVKVSIKALRSAIDMMLDKHEHVHVIMAEGNHDLASSVWLRAMFDELYENEPRVTVDNSHIPYYAYEWGKTSLFFHHGHKKNVKGISKVFAGKFRDMYGRTDRSYGHIGHLHHEHAIEDQLMKVRQHPTLASPDAYAVRGGWLSDREACVITYHKDFGRFTEFTITPEMLKAMA